MNALPKESANGSCITVLDFNDDGYADLFIGGGVMPGNFPKHDRNLLLQNDHGIFRDVADELAPELKTTGIVNCSAWGDLNGDNKNELVVSGEWMSPMIFTFHDGKFTLADAKVTYVDVNGKESKLSLSDCTGWWNCIRLMDIDGDGDQDVVLGNRGTNSKIPASLNEPCTVYAKDFDNNKSYDAVLGYYQSGKCYPMYHRDQLIDQMPMMRKKFIRYRQYAGKTLDEIFTDDQKKGMDVFKTAVFRSGVFMNDGNFTFHFQEFPEYAQLSCINDIVSEDFDGDGIKDLLIGGNSYDADVSTGNYDGQAVLFMKGSGSGKFTAMPQDLFSKPISGEVRRIVLMPELNSVILLRNGDAALTYKYVLSPQ